MTIVTWMTLQTISLKLISFCTGQNNIHILRDLNVTTKYKPFKKIYVINTRQNNIHWKKQYSHSERSKCTPHNISL